MFSYIKGTLQYKNNEDVVIECNGIGYRIYTSLSTLENIGNIGVEVRVFIYMNVREDALTLYGFLTQEELKMFELLISVSGVGPKAAISILSIVTPYKFSLAVITNDEKTLTKAQGVGKKVAQRIILELKDKIKKEQLNLPNEEKISGMDDGVENSNVKEAINALMVLGYNYTEAADSVTAVFEKGMEIEDLVKKSLKSLMR